MLSRHRSVIMRWATAVAVSAAIAGIGIAALTVTAGREAPSTESQAGAPTPTPSRTRAPSPEPTPTLEPSASVESPPEAADSVETPGSPAQPSAPIGSADPGSSPTSPHRDRPPQPLPIPPASPPPLRCANVVEVDLRSVSSYTSAYGTDPSLDTITGVANIWIRNLADTPAYLDWGSAGLTSSTGLSFTASVGAVSIRPHEEVYRQVEFGSTTRAEWASIATWSHDRGSGQASWTSARPDGCIPDAPGATFFFKTMPSWLN